MGQEVGPRHRRLVAQHAVGERVARGRFRELRGLQARGRCGRALLSGEVKMALDERALDQKAGQQQDSEEPRPGARDGDGGGP